jgi:hypothetical protein
VTFFIQPVVIIYQSDAKDWLVRRIIIWIYDFFKIETISGAIIAFLQQVISNSSILKNQYNFKGDQTGETGTEFIRMLLFFA